MLLVEPLHVGAYAADLVCQLVVSVIVGEFGSRVAQTIRAHIGIHSEVVDASHDTVPAVLLTCLKEPIFGILLPILVLWFVCGT